MRFEGEETVEFRRSEHHLSFQLGQRELICRILEGTFPDYERVIAKDNDRKATFDRKNLAEAVQPVALLTGDRARAVSMLIDGENTLVSDPDVNLIRKSLEALEHLVVIDIFMTETAELADVVLPATAWAETDGTFVNTERRVQRVREAVPPPGGAKPDWWILAQIGQRLGFPGFEWKNAGEVFDEACSLMPIYNGLSWERISP